MIIHGPYASSSLSTSVTGEDRPYARNVMRTVADSMLAICEGFLAGLRPVETVPPLLLDAIYRVTATYSSLQEEGTTRAEVTGAIKILRETLTRIDARWKAAGM